MSATLQLAEAEHAAVARVAALLRAHDLDGVHIQARGGAIFFRQPFFPAHARLPDALAELCQMAGCCAEDLLDATQWINQYSPCQAGAVLQARQTAWRTQAAAAALDALVCPAAAPARPAATANERCST